MIIEHDAILGKTIERKPTAEELSQVELDSKAFANREAEKQARLETKAAILKRLGITEEEAKLLG